MNHYEKRAQHLPPEQKLREYSPFPFTKEDLTEERLIPGVEYTLFQFRRWTATHPTQIDDFIQECQDQLAIAKGEYSSPQRIHRFLRPSVRENFRQHQLLRELAIFGIRNLAEIPTDEQLADFYKSVTAYDEAIHTTASPSRRLLTTLAQQFSLSPDHPEVKKVEQKLSNLYYVLPEKVVREGAMGKVARTMLGVAAIASYDLKDATEDEKRSRFKQVMQGAMIYGASYVIVDDTLHDLRTDYFSPEEKASYSDVILQGLRTGGPIDISPLPDHPLTEEMKTLYDSFVEFYPFDVYPHVYSAAEALFLAQERDSQRMIADTVTTTDLYPDMLIKAGMTRMVANGIGRRSLHPEFYRNCLASMLPHQLRDDLVDYSEDLTAKRATPFTLPQQEGANNPLYDLFAYDAYLSDVLYPDAHALFAFSQAVFLSKYLSNRPDVASEILQKFTYHTSDSLGRFLFDASHLSHSVLTHLTPLDQRVKDAIGNATRQRPQQHVDPRTFVADRLEMINTLLNDFLEEKQMTRGSDELGDIIRYALESGGKRLRPALTLMLSESLGVDPTTITPLLQANELLHTASLLFDDLPWQDNSPIRRGQPTAHMVFEAADVELSGISLLMDSLKTLQNLQDNYPPDAVIEVTTYTAHKVQEICLGQSLDLSMSNTDAHPPLEEILRMYHLKTAVALEAALLPLMMLEKRPQSEIDLMKEYAHHAGIAFQIKDDLLDMLGTKETIGKEVEQDTKKINIPRLYGREYAEELMDSHVESAIASCQALPFDTTLLQKMVTYFALRKK